VKRIEGRRLAGLRKEEDKEQRRRRCDARRCPVSTENSEKTEGASRGRCGRREGATKMMWGAA
jgi:hypothetical protein